MRNKLLSLLALSTTIATISGSALAGDFKLGYVDISKIFTNSKPAITLEGAMNSQLTPKKQELEALKNTISNEQQQVATIEKKNPNYDKLSAKDKAVVNKYRQDTLNLQQKYGAYQQFAQGMQDYAASLLLAKVNTILKDISDSSDYDLVLSSNQLVYAKAKYDLTDMVIEKLKSVDGDALVKQLNDAQQKALTNNGKYQAH